MRLPPFTKPAALGLLLAGACAGPHGETVGSAAPGEAEQRAELAARVGDLREEAKRLLATQAELYWRNWVYGDSIDVAATYRGHEDLFSPRAVSDVEKLRAATAGGDDRLALSFLRLYLASEAVGRAVAPVSQQIAQLRASATFTTPGGVEQPYRDLNRLLATEVSYAARGQLEDSALPVARRLDPLLAEKDRRVRAALARLGFSGAAAFATELRRVDPAVLAGLAEQVLNGTDAVYRAAMDETLHADLGIGLGAMREADAPRFDRAAALGSFFPPDKMLPILGGTLAGLGLDLAHQPNLRVDDAPLPKKDPRALCLPVAVPADVRLSVKPAVGAPAYAALFHEAGHCEHWAHAASPRFEIDQLGDGAASEAYALLFEGLVANPRWLAERVGLAGDRQEAFVRRVALRDLFRLRRRAGVLLFDLRRDAAGDPARLWRETLSRALGFPLSDSDAARWRVEDDDDFLAAADGFRAALLAAQLEAWLEKRAGPAWWDAPASGRALAGLWARGNALDADEVARRAGAPGLRADALLASVATRLAPRK